MSTKKGIVLSFCDRTGNMVKPWAEAGYQCWLYDMQHESGERQDGNIRRIGCDLRYCVPLPADKPAIVFAFPPCTHLAASGARWWKGKGLKALAEGIELVGRCADLCDKLDAPWMIENPIGCLSTHWRRPDAQFDPCDFGGYLDPPGDHYTKRTCLWVGNGFIVPIPKPVLPIEGSRMHLVSPSNDRANVRSETPMGFARAVFLANKDGLRIPVGQFHTPTEGSGRRPGWLDWRRGRDSFSGVGGKARA